MIENDCEFKYFYDWNEDEADVPDFQVVTNLKKNQKSQISEINQIQKNMNSSVPSEKLPSLKKTLNPTASILIQ